MREHLKTLLAEPDAALGQYLETLLREVPEVELEQLVAEVVIPEPVIDTTPAVQDTAEPEMTEEPSSAIPEWANGDFQVLRFRVGKLELAMPLKELDSILEQPEQIQSLPGQAPWQSGVCRYRDQQLSLVDTATVLGTDPMECEYTKVLVIGNGEFGLQCDQVARVMNLNQEDVRWSTEHADRPWLAGMLAEPQCSLLDPKKIALWLKTGTVCASNSLNSASASDN